MDIIREIDKNRAYCAFRHLLNLDKTYKKWTDILSDAHAGTGESAERARGLAYQLTHSQITHLLNRQTAESILKCIHYENADRACPRKVVFMDLSGFKGINDNFSYFTGDRVMYTFGQYLLVNIIHKATAWDDLQWSLVHYGGDEYLLLGFCPMEQYDLITPCRIIAQGGLSDELEITNELNIARSKLAETPLFMRLPFSWDTSNKRKLTEAFLLDANQERELSPEKLAAQDNAIRYAVKGLGFVHGAGDTIVTAEKVYKDNKAGIAAAKVKEQTGTLQVEFFWGDDDAFNREIESARQRIVGVETIPLENYIPMTDFLFFVSKPGAESTDEVRRQLALVINELADTNIDSQSDIDVCGRDGCVIFRVSTDKEEMKSFVKEVDGIKNAETKVLERMRKKPKGAFISRLNMEGET